MVEEYFEIYPSKMAENAPNHPSWLAVFGHFQPIFLDICQTEFLRQIGVRHFLQQLALNFMQVIRKSL